MVDTYLLTISFLVFIGVALLCLGGVYVIGQLRERQRLLRRIRSNMGVIQDEERGSEGPGIKRGALSVFGLLGRLARSGDGDDLSLLKKIFLRAGIRMENAPLLFLGTKSFLAIFFPLSFFVVKLLFLKALSPLLLMAICLLLASVGFYAPDLWLRLRTDRRKNRIQEGLPDALDLLVVCAEAGIGLDAAISRVGEEMRVTNGPLSEEFRFLSLELRAGKERREALKNLAIRTDLEDVKGLSTLLIQTERFGTSIAQALRVHSDSMRVKRFQRAEEVAAKLPVKLLFPLIIFIFPSLFVTILGPAIIRIYRTLLPTLGVQ